MNDDDDTLREVEEKLEILRARSKAYNDFVSPAGQPPLLWQMAMLADAGFTVLPPVRDPDPERSFPELTVAMAELGWSDDHYCLVGGERFSTIRVPQSHNGHFLRPKSLRPTFYAAPLADLPAPTPYEVEHFRRHDFALAFGREVRWRSRIMVCIGSRAEQAVRNRSRD